MYGNDDLGAVVLFALAILGLLIAGIVEYFTE
mgnify:FL=1|jgi:hypothetical protein